MKQNETIIIINAKTARVDIQLVQKMERFSDIGGKYNYDNSTSFLVLYGASSYKPEQAANVIETVFR